MNLAISNIAWNKEYDEEMYQYLKDNHIHGLEIAPTRLFEVNPYECLDEASKLKTELNSKYDLKICSMQSIWFGKTEKIFGTNEERQELIAYTKKAIIFAEKLGCNNLVFGSPKNRNTQGYNVDAIAIEFFSELGEFAYRHNTVLSLEANPVIYDTDFINTTQEAIEVVKKINSKGLRVNLDLGTIIYNNEEIKFIDFNYVHHIHISEPYLKKIKWQDIHSLLKEEINSSLYNNYISIEMENLNDLEKVKKILKEFKEIFEGGNI